MSELSSNEGQTGALLVNLGTPLSPRVRDVRRYLDEFLSDPRVIDIPPAARWLLLHAVILPFRPRRSAAAYSSIWTPRGSPLLVNSEALRDAVAERMGKEWVVDLAMRYGEPRIGSAVRGLADAKVDRVVVLPLYPQYSDAATGSTVAKVHEELRRAGLECPVDVVDAFYADPGFIAAWTAVAQPALAEFRPDFVLLSYHGLPERQIKRSDPSGAHCLGLDDCCDAIRPVNRDCYRAQCFATTRALASSLGLAADGHDTSFQSRLGRTPWIQPFTDLVIPSLRQRDVRRLAVLCPTFVADCLETLEEIGIRARDQWREAGGEDFLLVPSLNAEPLWADAVAGLLRRR